MYAWKVLPFIITPTPVYSAWGESKQYAIISDGYKYMSTQHTDVYLYSVIYRYCSKNYNKPGGRHSLTQRALSLSRKWSSGHWHPITHWLIQKEGSSSPHTRGQAVPHFWNFWPSTSVHSVRKKCTFETILPRVIITISHLHYNHSLANAEAHVARSKSFVHVDLVYGCTPSVTVCVCTCV